MPMLRGRPGQPSSMHDREVLASEFRVEAGPSWNRRRRRDSARVSLARMICQLNPPAGVVDRMMTVTSMDMIPRFPL